MKDFGSYFKCYILYFVIILNSDVVLFVLFLTGMCDIITVNARLGGTSFPVSL